MMIIDKISQAALSADRPGYERTSSSLWKQREEYCAALIQRAWTEFQVGIRVKGILHQKIFYCLNLIFWIVMGCGIARFGWSCLNATST